MVDVLDGFSSDGPPAESAIQTLAVIAPDDRFWDDVETFVARIRQLAAGKLAQRELKKREQELLAALGQLRGTGAEILAFHEASDVVHWLPTHFDPAAWPAATATCHELHDRLLQHAALQLAPPSNRTAARERRAQSEALEEQIIERLDTLRGLLVMQEPPPVTVPTTDEGLQPTGDYGDDGAPDDPLHAALDPDGDQYSVFTFGDERRISVPHPGVCLVFASPAGGLDTIEASIAGIARRRAALVEVPQTVQPMDVSGWRQANGAGNHQILWQRLGRWSLELGAGLLHLLEAQEASACRIVLVGGPAEARTFLALENPDLDARLDAVIPCRRWQLPAIEQRIRDAQLDPGSSGAAGVLAATRGWHRLLDVLWARKSSGNLDSMIAAFDSTFRSPGGYSGFWAALGLSAFPEAEAVFTMMATGGYSPRPQEAVQRWLVERGISIHGGIVVRAIAFLRLFQLLEADAEGNLELDPVARRVVTSQF